MKPVPFHGACAATLLAATLSAQAAEGFQVRYNLAGSLGGEMFAPPDQTGWGVGAAATYINIDKVTGGDGHRLKVGVPGGTVALGASPTPYDPSYAAKEVEVDGRGGFRIYNLALGYITTAQYGGGRLAMLVNLQYGAKTQSFNARTTALALNWPSGSIPNAGTKGAVTQQFETTYLARVQAMASGETGEDTGMGDTELQAGWLYANERWRVLAGASVVLPTGSYDSAAGPDVGAGNFYTFRPAVQVAWMPQNNVALAGKLTLGVNTRNSDNDLRSGNWLGLEGAAAYKTPLGPIGLHAIHIQQTQDDSGNPYGDARLRLTNAGVFFTTKLPMADAVVTLQTMRSTDSRYAKQGRFHQIRVIKVF